MKGGKNSAPAAPGSERAQPDVDMSAASPEALRHELRVRRIELERLRHELQKLSLAVEQSPASIAIIDTEGCYEYVNPTFTLSSGYSSAELLGRNARLLNSGRTPRQTFESLWDSVCKGNAWRGEFINRRKDGTLYTESANISPVFGTDGKVAHYVEVKEDLTDRIRAATELQTSETRLRLAKNAAGLGLFDVDMVADDHIWDARTREIWGFTADARIERSSFVSGLHPDDRTRIQAILANAADPKGTGAYEAEYRVVNAQDGRTRHVAAWGQVIFEDGRPRRTIGFVADITARKQLESEAQERRGQMDLLLRQQVAVQTVAAIAHELNQPLIAISAYSEAALTMLGKHGIDDGKLLEALEGARSQSQRAGLTLHTLLEFLNQGDIDCDSIDLNSAVLSALAIAADTGHHEFRPVLELQPDLPPVLANRLQIEKVIVNLLHNGAEAMREAGVPTADIRIKVRTSGGGTMAQVTIQDSGRGLDARTVHQIFDPFFTTKPNGMGLGLAISRSLIEAHGGQLWADLDAGPGATFHFTLPLAP